MNMGLIHSIWTLLLAAIFIGILAWAFSRRRKHSFDEAARMPLEDDDVQGCTNVAGGRMPRATDATASLTGDKRHG